MPLRCEPELAVSGSGTHFDKGFLIAELEIEAKALFLGHHRWPGVYVGGRRGV